MGAIVATLAVTAFVAPATPQALASEPPSSQAVLGVDAENTVALTKEVKVEEKFEDAAATDSSALVTKAVLLNASTKAVAPVAKKKPVAKKPAVKPAATKPAAKPAAKAATKPAAASVQQDSKESGGAWSSAKVSWYGPGFYGNTMAGGGTLQPGSMVVAHRTMAFGTKIEFKYNGRTCVAVVKDRGPHVSGRVFDLGPGTAKALGFSGVGTVQYRIVK